MGVTTCDIHGDFVGIGMACTHIIDNIKFRQNSKCIDVRIKYLPGQDALQFDKDSGPVYIFIPFCLQCYEDKRMTHKMKVTDDNAAQALEDFDIKYTCSLCINDYVKMNRIG
jgi:hypothetical protein